MNKDFRTLVAVALGVGFLCYPSFLPAVEIPPFYTQNQSPIIQIFGLPSAGEAALVPAQKADLRLIVDLANHFVDDTNPEEYIVLDGESTRISLDARYGISKNFEVGVVIPYLIQSGGFVDGFIDWYHTAFGFSPGGRDQVPRGRVLYRYQKDNQERLKMDQSSAGLGDLSLNAAWQVYGGGTQPSAVALRASLKLPTGDSDYLRGSGSTDLALWAVASHDFNVGYGHLTLYGAAGLMGMTDGEVLKDQQRNWVGFGVLGLGWSPVRWIAFKVQANGHTAFYKGSDLEELSGRSVQLTIGGTLAFSENTTLDVGVTEDVVLRTSPDVVFHLALRHRF